MSSETMFRMDAMRAAGLTPDLTVVADTLAPDRNGNPMLIPNQRWMALYNGNISVRLAYDQAKYGKRVNVDAVPKYDDRTVQEIYDSLPPEPTITPATTIEGSFVDITPIPQQKREPMSRTVLIATARGHAITFGTKDAYFAWLLTELADALEAAVDPDDATNLEDSRD